MRLHYYRFPDTTDQMVRLKEGCAVVLKNGDEIYPDNIPDDKWVMVDHIDDTLSGISITHAKNMIKNMVAVPGQNIVTVMAAFLK